MDSDQKHDVMFHKQLIKTKDNIKVLYFIKLLVYFVQLQFQCS